MVSLLGICHRRFLGLIGWPLSAPVPFCFLFILSDTVMASSCAVVRHSLDIAVAVTAIAITAVAITVGAVTVGVSGVVVGVSISVGVVAAAAKYS